MILAGDVGGTKVHLALYDFTNGKLKYTREERFPAKEYSGLEAIVKEFLGADKATAACFGVPGPVRDGRLRLTNLPWTLDSRELVTASVIHLLQRNRWPLARLGHDGHQGRRVPGPPPPHRPDRSRRHSQGPDRKSTRLNS